MIYTQLDVDNICVGVAILAGAVPEYNHWTPEDYDPITGVFTVGEPQFISRMIEVPVYSKNYIGLHYTDDGKWEKIA